MPILLFEELLFECSSRSLHVAGIHALTRSKCGQRCLASDLAAGGEEAGHPCEEGEALLRLQWRWQ